MDGWMDGWMQTGGSTSAEWADWAGVDWQRASGKWAVRLEAGLAGWLACLLAVQFWCLWSVWCCPLLANFQQIPVEAQVAIHLALSRALPDRLQSGLALRTEFSPQTPTWALGQLLQVPPTALLCGFLAAPLSLSLSLSVVSLTHSLSRKLSLLSLNYQISSC